MRPPQLAIILIIAANLAHAATPAGKTSLKVSPSKMQAAQQRADLDAQIAELENEIRVARARARDYRLQPGSTSSSQVAMMEAVALAYEQQKQELIRTRRKE